MSINPRFVLGDLDLTDAPFMVGFGADFGAPQNVAEILDSMLEDGEIVTSTRTSNRSMSLTVYIDESDMLALAEAEALLIAECDKPQNTLLIDPGDSIGPATVFDTFRAQAAFDRDDDGEMDGVRAYTLSIPALPFGRSANPTTVGSAFVANSATISDECESTTGWAATTYATSYGTFTVDTTAGNFVSGTGAVRHSMPVTATGSNNATATQTIQKTGLSISAASGGYLVMSIKTQWPEPSINDAKITTSAGGTQAVTTTIATAQANGFIRYAWAIPDTSTVTAIEFTLSQGIGRGGQSSPYVWFDAIGLSAASTSNQQSRTFDIGGSARTEGSIEIAAPLGLGDVVLYTARDLGDGFYPDLRRGYTTGGSVNTESGTINGSYVTLSSEAATPNVTLEAPVSAFRPGAYAVLARIKSNGSGTAVNAGVKATLVLGGTEIGATTRCVSPALTLPDISGYWVVCLGSIDLPPTVVDKASGGKIRFRVWSDYSGTRLDELMVFPLEDAALTWLTLGTGTPSATVASRLWIDAPSPTQPRGALLAGTAADRSDARAVVPKSRGRHLLYPGSMFGYLLTSAAGGPSMLTTYFKKWHSNAGD